ncbi:ATP-binding protein [Bacteroidota bacterium]
MIRKFAAILFLVIAFNIAPAQQYDSLTILEQLRQGSILEDTDKDSAMELYRVMLQKADSIGLATLQTSEACEKLANYEYYRGNTENAVTLALRALAYYKEIADTLQMTRIMILVGDILRGNELFDQSQEYLFNALTWAVQMGDSTLLSAVYNRMAGLGIDDTRIPQDSTEKFARLSLEIARSQGNELMIYNNLNILGVLEITRGNYRKSLSYLNEALTVAQKSFPEDEALILHNMARNHFLMGLPSIAVEEEKKAFKHAKEHNIPQYIRLSSSYLKDYYISVGNFEEALNYAIQYYLARDFITNQKVLVQLKEFNNQIEAEKQRSENQKLIYEQKLTDGRLRNFTIIGILLIVLLIVTTGFMLYQRRQRQQIRKIASRLDQSNKVLTRFISILGHDLRSPFNALLGFTDLLRTENELNEEERETIFDRLYTVSRSTYKLLERIMEWSSLQSGLVKPDKKQCDLSELVSETIQILESTAMLKNIEILFSNPGSLNVTADENMIQTVIRNITSNAIKFSHPGGKIEIWADNSDQGISLSIRDNGIGISPENLSRLFQLDNNYKSEGTAGEPGTGLGLILCKEYLEMHGGYMDIISEEGNGSTFTLTIPKMDQIT